MHLAPVKLIDLLVLCQNARADEIDQYECLRGVGWDVDEIANDLFNRSGVKFSLWTDTGELIVAGGWQPVIDGVLNSWMVGTAAAWQTHWRSITKASRKVMDTLLERDDTRRLQTMALAKRVRACDWYVRGLKMQFEATMRQFAANGEDVVIYSRVKEAG